VKRPSTGGVVRVIVAVVLTALVFWKSHPAGIWQALTQTRPGPILIAALLVLADRTLMAYRWLVLLRPFSGEDGPRFGAVMRIFFVSSFVGTFLPASVGGDAVRAYALAREGVDAPASVASVVMDRMLGVLSVLVMAVVGLAFARQMARDPVVISALAVTALVCAATAAVVFSRRADAVVQKVTGRLPWPAGRAVLLRLLAAIQVYATRHGDLVNVLIGSIGVQLLRIVQAYFLGQALGIAQPLTTYVAFIPLILLVMLLPVTVNGLGTSQLAFVWAFAQSGVPGAQSFPLSVLFVALGIVGNLPGALLYASGGMHARPRT
jgi:glycosyltransferase 2 family protein